MYNIVQYCSRDFFPTKNRRSGAGSMGLTQDRGAASIELGFPRALRKAEPTKSAKKLSTPFHFRNLLGSRTSLRNEPPEKNASRNPKNSLKSLRN